MALVKIASWTKHPHDILGEAIDFATHADALDAAQHSAFIRENGRIHELYWPQLRDRDIVDAERPFLKILDIEGLTPELSAKLEATFDANLAKGNIKYSILDLFRVELDIPMPSENSSFCSRYVFHTTLTVLPANLWLLQRCTDNFVSPRDVYISSRLHDTQ